MKIANQRSWREGAEEAAIPTKGQPKKATTSEDSSEMPAIWHKNPLQTKTIKSKQAAYKTLGTNLNWESKNLDSREFRCHRLGKQGGKFKLTPFNSPSSMVRFTVLRTEFSMLLHRVARETFPETLEVMSYVNQLWQHMYTTNDVTWFLETFPTQLCLHTVMATETRVATTRHFVFVLHSILLTLVKLQYKFFPSKYLLYEV